MAPVRRTRKEINDKRVQTATRKNYQSSVAKFTSWLLENEPDAVRTVDGTETMKVPLPNEDVIIDFLTDIQFTRDRETNENTKLTAFSTMNGARSAIMDQYREHNATMSPTTVLQISKFLGGYRRIVQDAKQNGELPMFEGKRNITYSGYKTLALEVLKTQGRTDSRLYTHPFITLSWNLFARSASVGDLLLHHFDWKEDSMTITLPKHKGDQEGLHVYPKHIYANPVYPELCPILSLGIYIFSTNHFTREGTDWRLFQGSNVNTKFSHWLKALLKKDIPELKELNHMKEDLGTHSFRKGVVTYVLSFPCGPSVVAAFLRACWSLGAVQQRYIFEGEGSDQFLGRVACGLPFGETQFQALPPRFDPSFEITLGEWEKIYPKYSKRGMPKGFLDCLPFLLASVVHHSSWLERTLPKNHPLLKSPLWTSNFVQRARGHILTCTKRCDRTNLVATGVPPIIDMKHDLQNLKECLKVMYEAMSSNTEKVTESFALSMQSLPGTLGEYLVRNFQINGAVPITIDQFNRFREDLRTDIAQEIRRSVLENTGNQASQPAATDENPLDYQTFFWRGHFHPVPEDFVFEAMNLRSLWNLWHNGDRGLRINPYKFICQKRDLQTETECNLFTRARMCMEKIETAGKDASGSVVRTRDEIFELGLNQLIQRIETEKRARNKKVYESRRYGEIAFSTLYKDFKYLYQI
jgi:hypothetical protein